MLLYKSLQRTKSIRPGDRFVVTADEKTIEFARKFQCLSDVEWFQSKTVYSVKEGMGLKYIFRPHTDDVVVYLDSDFLATKQLTFNLPPDTFAVCPEGPPTDSNYCGDFTLTSKFGATAGFFVYRYGPNCEKILNEIEAKVSQCNKTFFTLDQPWFNFVTQDNPNVAVINPSVVSFNGHGNIQEAALINCAGMPGDGPLHYSKMMNFFLMMV